MSYPLIILGAGASHDYIDDSYREGHLKLPPVTDELVDKRFLDREISSEYPEVEDLFSVIGPLVNAK